MSRPAQIRFLNRFAVAYDPVVHLLGFAPLWRAMADVAAPGHGEPALDVCTGTGGVAFELARRGARVIGVDLAAGMLRQARYKCDAAVEAWHADPRNGNHHASPTFCEMDARRLAFADRAFPLVTCTMALHEMAEGERVQVLQEIARVASDRVVLAEYRVPRQWWRGLLFRMTRVFEYVESDDFERFVRHDVGEQLVRAGLYVDAPHDVGAYRMWPCRVRSA